MNFLRFDWWRTVFFLIPTISAYTILLGTLSILSTFVDRRGHAAHWCARAWSWLILATTGVEVSVSGLERVERGRTYVFISNHQSIYDIPVIFASLPFQLRIIAKESLGRFPFLGWHLSRAGHLLVDRSNPDRAAILNRWRRLVVRSDLAHHLSRGHAKCRRPCRTLQGRQLSAGAGGRADDRSAVDLRQPGCHDERQARNATGSRRAAGSRTHCHSEDRCRPPSPMRAIWPRASKRLCVREWTNRPSSTAHRRHGRKGTGTV